MSPFEELLEEVGKIFHLSLHVDQLNACKIQVNETLFIQMQLDLSQENLWIFSTIAEIPPGKYRENVLKDALKANDSPEIDSATFALIHATSTLALFQKHPLVTLNGDKLSKYIGFHLMIANAWQDALANGRTSPLETIGKTSKPLGL